MKHSFVFWIKRKKIIIFGMILFVLSACTVSATEIIPTSNQTETATSTITVQPTDSSTPTKTITASPLPTITMTPTPSITAVPSSTSTDVKNLKQCYSIQEAPPPDDLLTFGFVGTDYLSGFQSVLETGTSPNGKWMAFIEAGVTSTEPPRTESKKLRLINSEGILFDLSYWTVDWQYILGWLDNERLALVIPGRPKGAITILNPFTGSYHEIIPTFDTSKISPQWSGTILHISINPQLNHIAYHSHGTLNLWDIQSEIIIWEGKSSLFTRWSPTGESLATILYDGDLIAIDLNGDQTTLINQEVQSFSWSPDGSQIAAWVSNNRQQNDHLVILNLDTGILTNTCIISSSWWTNEPTWSPDGEKIVIRVKEEGFYKPYKQVIIDLRNTIGYYFEIE